MGKRRKVLIVMASLGPGGTTSSLKSLLNTSFSKENDISILSICNNGLKQNPELDKYVIQPSMLIRIWFSSISTVPWWAMIATLPLKIIKNLPYISNIANNIIIKRIALSVLKKCNFDTVIAYSEYLTPEVVQHFNGINKIAWIHCDYGARITRKEEHIFKKFNTIVTVSDFTLKSFVKRYPSLKEKTTSIYNICSIDTIKAKAKEVIDDSNFVPSKFTIISVGRINVIKRFTTIPSIAKKVKEAGCIFKWYIIGSGDKKELNRIKNEIAINEVEEEIVLLGHKSNPYPYFKAADLLVSTSESEACPMIFNEAKILKLPIVSANFGSSYEFIEEGRDGYISDIDNIHTTIAMLINDKNRYNQLNPQINNKLKEETIIDQINIILNKV